MTFAYFSANIGLYYDHNAFIQCMQSDNNTRLSPTLIKSQNTKQWNYHTPWVNLRPIAETELRNVAPNACETVAHGLRGSDDSLDRNFRYIAILFGCLFWLASISV